VQNKPYSRVAPSSSQGKKTSREVGCFRASLSIKVGVTPRPEGLEVPGGDNLGGAGSKGEGKGVGGLGGGFFEGGRDLGLTQEHGGGTGVVWGWKSGGKGGKGPGGEKRVSSSICEEPSRVWGEGWWNGPDSLKGLWKLRG